jgi:phospholipid/cholesterol/gamma-HCH transport system substrate-binding protein
VLTKLAEAGDALPKAFQVFLTYPFTDEVVGRNPTQARNLHMGDYTNLSIQLDVDLRDGLPPLPGLPKPPSLVSLCKATPLAPACDQLGLKQLKKVCKATPLSPLCDQIDGVTGGNGGGNGDGGGDDGGPLGGLLGGGNGDNGGSGGGNGGDGGGGAGGGDGGGGGCVIPLLCRPAPDLGPGLSPRAGASAPHAATTGGRPVSSPSGADAGHGYDSDLGALLVWGMVAR